MLYAKKQFQCNKLAPVINHNSKQFIFIHATAYGITQKMQLNGNDCGKMIDSYC